MSQEGGRSANKQFSSTRLHLPLPGGESGTIKGAVKRVSRLLPQHPQAPQTSPSATDLEWPERVDVKLAIQPSGGLGVRGTKSFPTQWHK